jgi:hypothetical protein
MGSELEGWMSSVFGFRYKNGSSFSSEGKEVSVLSEQTHKGAEFGGGFPP